MLQVKEQASKDHEEGLVWLTEGQLYYAMNLPQWQVIQLLKC